MFYHDKSTKNIGVCYGGEERPLEGELSEAHTALVDAEEAEMRAEQERLNAAHKAEQERVLATLPECWRRFYKP